MKKLRLLITDKCDRACEGCCNKQWDLAELPRVKSLDGFDQIILTGGEPMLDPEATLDAIWNIRKASSATLYLYTAKVDDWLAVMAVLSVVDGICITLHEQADVAAFAELISYLVPKPRQSLRLNVFTGVDLGDMQLPSWLVKRDIKWIADCPLPEDEVFMRL